jgi:hypothetical protein
LAGALFMNSDEPLRMMQKASRFVHVAPLTSPYTITSVTNPAISFTMISSHLLRPILPVLCGLVFALPGRVLGAEILFFDDFTGPAEDLSTRLPKQGKSSWLAPLDSAEGLKSDGNGRAVFDPEDLAAGKRKFAWVNTGASGDEYYVAAQCSIDGAGANSGGWAAVGFAEDSSQPLDPVRHAAALFGVNSNGKWLLWVRGRRHQNAQLNLPPFSGSLEPITGFTPGMPATLALRYTQSTGLLEAFVNGQRVHAVPVKDPVLPVGSAVLAFHVDEQANANAASQIFAQGFLVSDGKTEMPASGSAP